MMRAVVMEIKSAEARAIILRDDGVFAEVRDEGYEVGQQIDCPEVATAEVASPAAKRTHGTARIVKFASSIAACLVLLGFGIAFFNPYAYATLDVNPSVGYSVNVFNLVLSVDAVDEEAAPVVSALDASGVRFKPIQTAVDDTVGDLYDAGYLSDAPDSFVVLAVACADAEHAEALTEQLSSGIAASYGELVVIGVSADEAQKNEADQLGTTAGKLYIVRQAQQAVAGDGRFDVGEWVDRPIAEIMQVLQSHDAKLPSDVVYSTGDSSDVAGRLSGSADSQSGSGLGTGGAGGSGQQGTGQPSMPGATQPSSSMSAPDAGTQGQGGSQNQGAGQSNPASGGTGGGSQPQAPSGS